MSEPADKLTIQLAYLHNAWEKIARYRDRLWATAIIHNTFYFLLLTNDDINELIKRHGLQSSLLVFTFSLSILAAIFCAHLRDKINIHRKIIKSFEETYPQQTTSIVAIRGKVTDTDLGDNVVCAVTLALITILSVLVYLQYSAAV